MDNVRYQIIAGLEAGESPDMIAAKLDIPKTKVLRIKIAYDKAIIDGTLDQMVDVDGLVLANVLAESRKQVPSLKENIDEVGKAVSDGLERLRALDEQLISTAMFATTRIRTGLATCNTSNEAADFVNSLCKLREAFFNKNVTQVNIQNNVVGSEGNSTYGEWLSDKPN